MKMEVTWAVKSAASDIAVKGEFFALSCFRRKEEEETAPADD